MKDSFKHIVYMYFLLSACQQTTLAPTEKEKPRMLISTRGFGLSQIYLDFEMVEVAGVEPASENTPLTYLHA